MYPFLLSKIKSNRQLELEQQCKLWPNGGINPPTPQVLSHNVKMDFLCFRHEYKSVFLLFKFSKVDLINTILSNEVSLQ